MDNKEIAGFFRDTPTNIYNNPALREPQREGYNAILSHFDKKQDPCYVQLPVGCGKTGLMGLTPFEISDGRILIIAPNLTIRSTIYNELNISDEECFYFKRGVFETTTSGPFISELKIGANKHDCDDAHIVLTNIQQFAGEENKWFEKFSNDYFKMILVDEGHHNVAPTWQRLFEYFNDAKVISYTATPVRSDGQKVTGKCVYNFSYTRSMLLGYISPVDSLHVAPEEITFTAKGEKQTLSLEDVRQMREQDWFSRGIALSEECNRHIVQASITQLSEVRKHGSPRMIIACACSIRHAEQVASLYREYGLKVEVLHSKLRQDERDRIESALRNGFIDAIVQVQMLGEGYDLGQLSVAAVFRPYRSLAPYIQFVGRILRLADPKVAHSPGNRVYIVSHIGLNDERWWHDFRNFDQQDQDFFATYFAGADERLIEGDQESPRMSLRPFMRVLNETVSSYVQRAYLTKIDETMVHEFISTIKEKGFDPIEFGLTEDIIRTRLEFAAQTERTVPAQQIVAQPQNVRESLRKRAYQEARSIADTVLNRLQLKHGGYELVRAYPGKGTQNATILITLAQGAQNKKMDIQSGERDSASREQFSAAVQASPDIVDQLTSQVQERLGKQS